MSRVLSFFSRFLLFFDRSNAGGGAATELMDPVAPPSAQEPLALTEAPVINRPARATPEKIAQRDMLREVIRGYGMDPMFVQTISGDCPLQVDTQIGDYNAWLAKKEQA
jgi:hypothetical protein